MERYGCRVWGIREEVSLVGWRESDGLEKSKAHGGERMIIKKEAV